MCACSSARYALIVGDMVASEGTILIAPGDGDMARYLTELRRMSTWGARIALPAHGEPIDDPAALFAHYVAHRLAREAKVLTAVRSAGNRGAPADELVPSAYADTPVAVWPLAFISLQAHLIKLASDGMVTERDGRYSCAAVGS